MARAHQVGARILAGAHQVAGGLVDRIGNPHAGELAGAQQPRQPLGV